MILSMLSWKNTLTAKKYNSFSRTKGSPQYLRRAFCCPESLETHTHIHMSGFIYTYTHGHTHASIRKIVLEALFTLFCQVNTLDPVSGHATQQLWK